MPSGGISRCVTARTVVGPSTLNRTPWLASVTKLTQVGRFVFSTRKPVELIAATTAANGGGVSQPAEAVLGSEAAAAKPAPAPRKPLTRSPSGDGDAPARQTRAAEAWVSGGQ